MKVSCILIGALIAALCTSCVSTVLTAPIKVAGAATSSAIGVTKAIVTSGDE